MSEQANDTSSRPMLPAERSSGESAVEYPILCESCLGPNPYVRMLQDKWGRPCKICERPFQTFRWHPAGPGMRAKKTEICQVCARVKNVCQTCILDLSYGLPVQVRDAGIAPSDRQATIVPSSDVMRQYAATLHEASLASTQHELSFAATNRVAEQNKRVAPRYERNRAQLCSWYAKGKCARGLYCPYRHEMPRDKDHPFSKQNLQDRYYGVNDPVAASILARSAKAVDTPSSGRKRQNPPPQAPDDIKILSLFIAGLTSSINEQILRSLFSHHEQHISSIRILAAKSIAFIDFDTREAAENAISDVHGQWTVADAKLSISWAKGSKRDQVESQKRTKLLVTEGNGGFLCVPQVPDISGLVPNVQPPPRQVLVNAPNVPENEPQFLRDAVNSEASPKDGSPVNNQAKGLM